MNHQQNLIEDLLDDAADQWLEDRVIDLVTASRLAGEGYMLGNLGSDMGRRVQATYYGD